MMPKNAKSSEDLLKEISGKLDKLMGVLAIQGKNQAKQISILKNLGFSSSEIGAIVGINPSTLRKRKGWKQK